MLQKNAEFSSMLWNHRHVKWRG